MILTEVFEIISEESIEGGQNAFKVRWFVAILDFQAHRQTVVDVSGFIFCTSETTLAPIRHISPSIDHTVVAIVEVSLSILVVIGKEMCQLETSYLSHLVRNTTSY